MEDNDLSLLLEGMEEESGLLKDFLTEKGDLCLLPNHLSGKHKSLLHLLAKDVKSLLPEPWVEKLISSNSLEENKKSDEESETENTDKDEDYDECCMLLLKEPNNDEVLNILEPDDIERELLSGEYFTNAKLPESDLIVSNLDKTLEYYSPSWEFNNSLEDDTIEDCSTKLSGLSDEVGYSQTFNVGGISFLIDFHKQDEMLKEYKTLKLSKSPNFESSPNLDKMQVAQVDKEKQEKKKQEKRKRDIKKPNGVTKPNGAISTRKKQKNRF